MKVEPIITKKLIEKFQALFPDRLPTHKGVTAEQLAFLQGQQSVVQRMIFLYEDDQQEEN
mgnify:CR=1 FL=1